MSTVSVKNTYHRSLGLGGVTIPAGQSADVPNFDCVSKSHAVKVWLEKGILVADKGAVKEPDPAQPKTVAEVLAMAEDGTHFQTFKASATDILGDATPATKDEIVAALKARA